MLLSLGLAHDIRLDILGLSRFSHGDKAQRAAHIHDGLEGPETITITAAVPGQAEILRASREVLVSNNTSGEK